ncbi:MULTISPECIES: amino acid permease [Brevibacillus]|jgi:arginine/ornithine permease|uniref:Amino acid permease n=1 Tax=Brevibacillus parabrevis TaxID=54914 RepID=A0A4Y3PL80_BREPA|nr:MULTISPECIES: amino acid permease [Brevibacillus]MBU8713477.1 amino acid permease [Brevibacillus parabrevis]MDR4997676.1 amino acid permease [Brevibacillus parabrevis]MED2255974.1 amino acid permease [Brevibacillus parabrevis]NRQ53270.1 amino acid permease [Brevibacillus sp. HD1.4A]RNB97164.1 amino acid permease [Brevibacillus parabrevis]
MNAGNDKDKQLQRSMKSRHLFMLSLGGVIGTGLFLNAGYTINQAGPGGALVAFVVGGILLYLVMTCLGELSVKMPVTGSFQTYATKYIGPASGFTLGWMYWLGSATTAGVEFTAAGMVMQRWFPDTPIWIWCALFILLLFTFNALTTKGFAETEYWFAGIKVLAVLIFIIVGLGAIFGIVSMEGREAPFFSNFSADGGLFPFGFAIVFVTMMNVVFSYQGSELIGIAAGETENPHKNIPRAIRNVVFRILVFYVASVMILSALFPSSELGLLESPFVTVFDSVGIPFAADIMNFVILTALLSVGNSCLYAATRLLWALSHSGMAHPAFGKLTKRSVPLNSLLATLAFSLLSLLTSVIAADTVYVLLMSVSGIAVTFTWMGIALSQFNFRRKYLQEGGKLEDLQFVAPFYPVMPLLCLALCTFILIFPAFDPTQRVGLFYGIGALALFYLYYYLRYGRNKKIKPDIPTQG